MVQCKPKKSAEIDSQRYRCDDQSSLPAPHLALRAGFFQELGAGFLEAVALLGGEAGDAVLGDFIEEGVDGFDDVVARGGGLGERDGARLGEGAEMLAKSRREKRMWPRRYLMKRNAARQVAQKRPKSMMAWAARSWRETMPRRTAAIHLALRVKKISTFG
jgi:hypothetical protein